MYGKRATPYEVLTEFSGQVAGTGSIAGVLPGMARMLGEATGAERAEVWMRDGRDERLMAGWPAARAPASPDSELAAGDPTAVRDDETVERGRVFEVVHQGERLGSLRVVTSPREPLTPAAERLIQAVSGQAGLVLRNVALIEDVRSSRHRLVAAADEARRGLERDLHDGAEQQLIALRINLGLVRQAVRESPEEAADCSLRPSWPRPGPSPSSGTWPTVRTARRAVRGDGEAARVLRPSRTRMLLASAGAPPSALIGVGTRWSAATGGPPSRRGRRCSGRCSP